MQYAASLTAIGVLSISLAAAVTAQMVYPDQMLQQPMWPTDVPLMMRLQETRFGKPDISPAKTSQHTSDGASVLVAAAHEHEHRSPGKPGADVTLASAGIRTLTLGSPSDLQLQLQSHLPAGSLHVRVEPSDDLQLLSDSRVWDFELHGEQVLTLPLTVQALVDGQHYVHLFIEHVDAEGNTSARALATELRVGEGFITNTDESSLSYEKSFSYDKNFSTASRSEFSAMPVQETIY